MIFNSRPKDWQELQTMVGQLFNEIGYQVEVSKVVELVRGKKEVDVYVQDNTSEYKPIFLIECKYWNTPVKQETVHSFHTVINDFGANFGFIVSKAGFQAGCFEAAKKTNIKLVLLEELEKEYYSKWQLGMIRKYMPLADKLFPYWDPSGGKMPKDGKPLDYDTHMRLNDAYTPFISLGPDASRNGLRQRYPLKLPVLDEKFIQVSTLLLKNDRDYFDFIEANKEKVFQQFKKFYRE